VTHPAAILAFDPSTTRTGWALMDRSGTLLNCGAIPLTAHPAEKRAGVLFDAVRALANDERVICDMEFAIEWPGQHTHRRVKGASGAGLAVYGTAPGVVYGALRSLVSDRRIGLYTPAVWTPGNAKKEGRAAMYRLAHPAYAKAKDKACDIADAIGVAEYAWQRINLERSIA
jgi:Holliday junction resolvasome RuvABC endonuclease subunit